MNIDQQGIELLAFSLSGDWYLSGPVLVENSCPGDSIKDVLSGGYLSPKAFRGEVDSDGFALRIESGKGPSPIAIGTFVEGTVQVRVVWTWASVAVFAVLPSLGLLYALRATTAASVLVAVGVLFVMSRAAMRTAERTMRQLVAMLSSQGSNRCAGRPSEFGESPPGSSIVEKSSKD